MLDKAQRAKKPNPVDVHIGARIRARRIAMGKSQEKMGNAIGITFQQVQKYEKGTNRIGGSRMQQIADFLGVSPSYFFEGVPSHGVSSDVTQDSAIALLQTTDGQRLVRLWSRIGDSEARRKLLNVIELVAAHPSAE